MVFKKVTAALAATAVIASMMASFTVAHAAEITLTVGTDKTYKTISAAVAAAKELNPSSEADRVTINVDPGNYEEQVRIDGMKYLTLQQTPGTEADGRVNLSWYFCTNYYTSNTDLNGLYDPKIDWSLDETWNGYKDGDEKFTKYTIGQDLSGVSTISYYDTDGVAHKNVAKNSMLDRLGGLAWSYDKMAPLIVTTSSSDITIKDFNLVNSTMVMKTKGQDDGHLTPNPSGNLPDHKALSICDETTALVKPTADIYSTKDGSVDLDKYKAYVANQGEGFKFTPGESAWLLQSSGFNERGHAIAILGDRIICENVRVRGNQDSVWVSDGRTYFKNCDLIGGTDYIYGSASTVFDHCKLGFAGFTDKSYGSPLATPNTPASRKYGYLFFNCTIYNVRENNGANNFGGPWGVDGQSTFYNTTLDDKAEIGASPLKIEDKGWGRFGAENGKSRLYEFGTTNNSGAAVDLSKRVKNLSVAEGGPGMGTVLDKWQILEFNPRNVFSTKNDSKWAADWDPMNFSEQLADTDAEIEKHSTITIEEGTNTTFTLPASTDDNIELYWESNDDTVTVSEDNTSISFIRPAYGEGDIKKSLTLYARNKTTGYGDKAAIELIIEPSTDAENVFTMPVVIKASSEATEDCPFKIELTKDGALIKRDTVTLKQGQKLTAGALASIPVPAVGDITYDVTVTPVGDEYTVTYPVDGKATVTGSKGASVDFEIDAVKVSSAKTDLNVNFSASAKQFQCLNLIDLVKAADPEADGYIDSSDIVTVKYSITPNNSALNGYIDLRATPSTSTSEGVDTSRFLITRMYQWNQFDTIDGTRSGYEGASNIPEHQWLNIAGKYNNDTTTPVVVTATINYKTGTIYQEAEGSGDGQKDKNFTFTGFPAAAEKGSLYLALSPKDKYGDGNAKWTLSDVSVTYLKPESIESGSETAVFSMPLKVTQGSTLSEDVKYTVTVKNSVGAKIAEKALTVAANETEAADTISNLDASETYTVTVSVDNVNLGIISDKTYTVKGIKDQAYPINIKSASSEAISPIEFYASAGTSGGAEHAFNTGNRNNGTTDVSLTTTNSTLINLLKDETDNTKIASKYTANYANYLGSGNNGSPLKLTATIPAGKYTLYLFGYNNDNGITATINGKNFYAAKGSGEKVATVTQGDLYAYAIDFTLDEEITNSEISLLNSSSSWLPDTYAVIITGSKSPAAPEPNEAGTIALVLNGGKNDGSTDNTSVTYYDNTETRLPDASVMSKEGNSFAGWYDNSELTGDAVSVVSSFTEGDTYYAKWTPETYTITWIADGSIIKTDKNAAYGTEIEAPDVDAVPVKAADAQYTYTFTGWSGLADGDTVSGDKIYVGVYSKTVNKYTITWKNDDNSTLGTTEAAYGRKPSYGATPTKQGDAQYSYVFKGWTPEITEVTEAASYTAEYDRIVNKYKVTFVQEDGSTVIEEKEYSYGETPVAPQAPAKAEDEQYTYAFDGWDKEITAVSGAITYTAHYAATAKHIYLDLLSGKAVTIEKKAGEAADSVVLEAAVLPDITDTPLPILTAYIAVYDGTALKSVSPVAFTQGKATITKPAVSGTESYKIFIWEGADNAPLLIPITAETTGNNKLFD